MAIIHPTNLIATPETMGDLEAYISRLPVSDRAIALTCAGMAWNLACKLTKQEENKDA